MSRSCHSVTFSKAGTTALRTTRASPVRFSVSTGLRLCGIAELPFWPSEKNSSASRTSVRCRCRISVARFSIEAATTASIEKNTACRSRGMTCVDTGSTASPSFFATCSSTRGAILAKVPTAPEMAQVAISARAGTGRALGPARDQPGAVAGEGSVVAGQLDAERRGLGMDAVAAADGRRVLVLQRALLQRGQQPVDVSDQDVGRLGELHRKAGVQDIR